MVRRANVLGGVYARAPRENEANITTEHELRVALKNVNVQRINVMNDIEITQRLDINREVHINGGNRKWIVNAARVPTLFVVANNVGKFTQASPSKTAVQPIVIEKIIFISDKVNEATPQPITKFMSANQYNGIIVQHCTIYSTTLLTTAGTDTTVPSLDYGIYFNNNVLEGNVNTSAGAVRGAFTDNRWTAAPTVTEYNKWTGFEFDTNPGTYHVVDNYETPSIEQRFYQRLRTPDTVDAADDHAAIYGDANHATGEQRWNMIFEIGTGQTDADAGGSIKFIHFGSGDAMYGALFGSGSVLFEAACFHDQAKGVIATNQYLQYVGSLGDYDAALFDNNTHFSSAWGWDGTGGSVVKSNFGTFWADRSLGHAFGIRIQNRNQSVTSDMTSNGVTSAGVVDDTYEMRIIEWGGRQIWGVTNIGNQLMACREATASTTTRNAPQLLMKGAYWNGSASVDITNYIHAVTNNTNPGTTMNFAVGGAIPFAITVDAGGGSNFNFGNYPLTNIDWNASDDVFAGYALKISKDSYATGTRTLSGSGLMAGGYVNTDGVIEATGAGAISLAWVREDSTGTATVSSSSFGTYAQGVAWANSTGDTTLRSRATGAFAHGYVFNAYTGTTLIDANQTGSFVGGYADAYSATIEAQTGGGGSFVHGAAYNVAILRATGVYGAFVNGYATGSGSNIIASANGAFSAGYAAGGNAITASGAGSMAFGDSTSGAITASAANSMQLGVGSNSQATSFKVGAGIRICSNAAPGTPANGDIWLATNDVTIRTAGVNLVFNQPTVSGSTGGNAALQNLCAALATMGLITDSTT